MKLYVIRHGVTDNNVKSLINGRNDLDINNQGIKESGVISLILKDMYFDKIYCSPLLRAKHTMEIVNSNNIPFEIDERLTERDAGVMTNKPIEELDMSIWYDLNVGVVYGGSESFKEVIERVKLFLEELKNKHENDAILLVTHAGILKALEVIIYGYPGSEEIVNWKYPHCVINKYII